MHITNLVKKLAGDSGESATIAHEQLDKLNLQLDDKLSQLRDAGVAVDSCPAKLSDPANRDRIRGLLADLRKDLSPVVKPN